MHPDWAVCGNGFSSGWAGGVAKVLTKGNICRIKWKVMPECGKVEERVKCRRKLRCFKRRLRKNHMIGSI